jgi:SAM-dependent methyltransferase
MTEHAYVGSELELFAHATIWKSYVRRRIRKFVGREVLEVGAGLGGSTLVFCDGTPNRWVCLEPDPSLAAMLSQAIAQGTLPACCEALVGTLADVPAAPAFDTLLYLDVLEHIEDDRVELAAAAKRLRPGGHLIVLAPAHPWLYTPFDQAIGHYRRYTKRTLRDAAPEGLSQVRLDLLDSVGLLASLGNKLLLRSAAPSAGQIAFWDKVLVRLSRVADPLLGFRVGKSVLGVWCVR